MAIFETIRENIGAAGQSAAGIAKKTAEALRLRDQIRRDNKEIRKLTYEIGQTYLRLHADDYEEVYKEFIDGIAEARADIEEKRNQLTQLREKPEAEEAEEDILAAEDDKWDDLFDSEAAEAVKEAAGEIEEAVEETAEEVAAAAEEAAEIAEETVEEVKEAAADLQE